MLATTGHTIVTQNVGRLIVCTLMSAKVVNKSSYDVPRAEAGRAVQEKD